VTASLRIIPDILARIAGRRDTPWWTLALVICVAAASYGAVMGSWRVFEPGRIVLVLIVASKMPLLICGTTLICMPGFFVLNTVLGLRADFAAAMRAVLAGQAALCAALLSLAPVTRFVYMCGVDHRTAILFNAAMFTLATVAAQVVMFRRYRPLMERRREHAVMLWVWVGMYAFVGMQMGWMLRPFIGNPAIRPTFFREEPFTNAYVVIVRLIFGS
jgi:hypothetical protein